MTRDRLQIVEELFEEALRLPPERREESLRRACGSDTALLEEVQSLLAAHEETTGFIETSAYNVFADVFASAENESLEGKEIGHYKVASMIGRGGMGEVYLAEDNMLGRKVAIKVLPPSPAHSSARLERFIREARAASALNHPNIITIHEVGRFEDSHYIAQEFVQGQTLKARLAGKPFDVALALNVALQVGQALSASHAAGVVHRDIKPENIMIRPDGVVKVLDFGLAKFTEAASSSFSASGGFMSDPVKDTLPGTVMGTVTYMSPEQARGSTIDARTDVFSLGVVLYEMICGRPPFKGDTPSDTVAEILKSEPKPPSQLRDDLPVGLDDVILKALGKDAGARYQTIDEMIVDLKAVDPSLVIPRSLAGRARLLLRTTTRRLSRPIPLVVVSFAVVATVALAVLLVRRGAKDDFKIPVVNHRTVVSSWKMEPAEESHTGRFSPDATAIALCQTKNGRSFISIKKLSGGDPIPITDGKMGETSPIWSPDGAYLAYAAGETEGAGVWVIPSSGGRAQLLESLGTGPSLRLIWWAPSSNRIYYERGHNLFALDAVSKKSVQLTKFDLSASAGDFSISPDEIWTAYTDNWEGHSNVWVSCLDRDCSRKVTNEPEQAAWPQWLPDSRTLAYSSKRAGISQLYVAFLDGRAPVQITFGENNQEVCDVSTDGSKMLCASSSEECDIWSVDPKTATESDVTSDAGLEIWPHVSADGRTLLFQSIRKEDEGRDYVHSSISTRTVRGQEGTIRVIADAFDPLWEPNANRISFLRSENGVMNIWSAKSDGSDQTQLTTDGIVPGTLTQLPYGTKESYSWSADGARVAYCSVRGGVPNMYVRQADGHGESRVTAFTDGSKTLDNPVLAADGSRLAYISRTAGIDSPYAIWLAGDNPPRILFRSATEVVLLGWLPGTDNLLVGQAITGTKSPGPVADVNLLELRPNGNATTVATTKRVYLRNMALSPDGTLIAMAERTDGADNLWVFNLQRKVATKITNNRDPRLYMSGLSWSYDGRAIYFGKQADSAIISVVDFSK